MEKHNLAILLATYNSQKFLAQQLESLFNQTNRDWTLYIRDDGSTDATISIIEDFMDKYSNIKLITDNESGLGPMKSFLELLRKVEAYYYMFCDHDDIWLPEKVSTSINSMQLICSDYPDKPVIVHTDLIVVNDNLEVINSSFWKLSAIKPKIIANRNLIQVFNCVTGCTMIINEKVKKISFPFIDDAPMHDWWLALQTLRKGGIIKHIAEPTILYRQHGSNEVGARNVQLNYFVQKINNFQNTLEGHSKQIRFLKQINGLNSFQYYYYKLFYTLWRKI